MKNALKFGMIICAVLLVGFGIYAIAKQGANSGNQAPVVVTGKSDILKVNQNDNIKGAENAPITIIDYSDFQCPYCVKFDGTMKQIMAAYPNEVKWVYRHYPLPFHKAAKGAAIAAEAAGKQGRYWEFAEKLVENSQPDGKGLQSDDLNRYAGEVGLDMARFQQDLSSSDILNKINQDIAGADSLEIQGTPFVFIIDKNGKTEQLAGALSFDQLKPKIDAALK